MCSVGFYDSIMPMSRVARVCSRLSNISLGVSVPLIPIALHCLGGRALRKWSITSHSTTSVVVCHSTPFGDTEQQIHLDSRDGHGVVDPAVELCRHIGREQATRFLLFIFCSMPLQLLGGCSRLAEFPSKRMDQGYGPRFPLPTAHIGQCTRMSEDRLLHCSRCRAL